MAKTQNKHPVIEIEDLGSFMKIISNSYSGKTVIENGVETWHPSKEKKLGKSEIETLWKKAKGETA
jgi:hypothetical protein